MTTKNTVKNIRDLGAAIEAKKPDVSIVANRLLEAFGDEYAKMDQVKAHRANLVSFQALYDEKAKAVPGLRKFVWETEKAIAVAKSDAQIAIKENSELNELRVYLKTKGKDAEWEEVKAQVIMEDYVIPLIGQASIDRLGQIKKEIPSLAKELEDLKTAIENEKKAIAELA